MESLFVFVLLGPVLGLLVGISSAVIASGQFPPPDLALGCAIVSVFSLIVSVIAGSVDAILSYAVPISLRAPLTAIVGAAVAVGLMLYVGAQLGGTKAVPFRALMLFAILGALITGVCSLASDYFRR